MSPSAAGTPPTRPAPSSARSRAEQVRAAAASFPICLVTGGAGYIGSHTVLELLTAGFAVVVIDNLSNSHMESLVRVHYIARTEFDQIGERERPVPPVFFHNVDIRDARRVDDVFAFWQDGKSLDPEWLPVDIAAAAAKKAYPMLPYTMDTKRRTKVHSLAARPELRGGIVCVIHFAALKAVGESLSIPLDYYEVNVASLLFLLKAMRKYAVNTFVFSSSAVVYGRGNGEGITEDAVQIAGQGNGGGLLTNPYGRTKWMSEEIIHDFCVSHPPFHATSLRYFNPTGAHPSGLIGENPKGTPNNIVPVILQAYERRRSRVQVFGSSYDTADGTGVRDYIHVSDLAKGHLAALRKAVSDRETTRGEGRPEPLDERVVQYHVYNLGTGRGYSVLEIIQAFSTAAGADVPFAMGDARAGDLGTVTASPDKAATELDWTAEFGLQDMCRDVFNWAAANPGGYEKLRRLSTLSAAGLSAGDVRRASVAAHLFDSEDEYDAFVHDTVVPLSGANARPQSVASLTALVQRAGRMSISSSSSDEDRGGGGQLGASSASSAASKGFGPLGGEGQKQPSFNMNWSGSSRGPLHADMTSPIEEEE